MRCSKLLLLFVLLVGCLPLRAAEIKGPSKVALGMPAIFTMVGIPAEHAQAFNWQVFAAPADALVLDLADRAGNPVLMFWSPTAARCAVIADVNVPGQFELLLHEFTVGGPSPKPDPGPGPKPDPAPAEEVSCLLLYESEDVDDLPYLGNITTSQTIRRLDSPKCHLLFADKDELNERDEHTPAVKTWVEYAARHKLGLPRWFIVDEKSGALVATAAAPRTVAETVDFLRRYAP
jgi:hypothetical protein